MHSRCSWRALLPSELAAALTGSLNTPHLQARLAKATEVGRALASPSGAGHLDWLAKNLFRRPAPVPTAPYAHARLAGRPAPAYVWHADPVHIEVSRDHLLVQSLGRDPLSQEESAQLLAAANECATAPTANSSQPAGIGSLSESDGRWTPTAVGSDRGHGRNAGRRDAQIGPPHNDIQMAWHAHDVNAERETKGSEQSMPLAARRGTLEVARADRVLGVHSDAPEWQGAAQAAGAPGVPASAPWRTRRSSSATTLDSKRARTGVHGCSMTLRQSVE